MTPPEDGQPEPAAPSAAGVRVTHFNFQARVFQAPGAHFELVAQGAGRPKEAMFGVNMGNGHAVIALKHLRENFGIMPGSFDDQLVERAEQGLKYVPDIRPGDAIPNELLDGTASWTVGRKHKKIARERIQGALLGWITGKPVDVTDRAGLTKIMDAPETKTALRDGFKRAAAELGLKDDTDQVVDRIETLARELCYIEALRDRVRHVSRIRDMIKKLIKAYSNDQRAVDEMNRCHTLMKEGWREISAPLAAIDQQIADVMSALQTIDKAIAEVRRTRDEIHFILMQWDPVLARWEHLVPDRGQLAEKALQALYRLLASRFPSGKSLMAARRG